MKVENDHEPIVSRETFQQVQGEFLRRMKVIDENGISNGYSACYALTGKLLPDCSRSLEALEARTEEIRESISADLASGVASYSAVGSYSASPAPSSAPSSSHPSLENQQDISVIFAINQELDQIRARKNELRETMSSLSLEKFNLSKVLEYLETSCYDNKNDGIDGFVYDDAALLPILERVLVLDKGFEISFVVGKTYKV